MREDALPAFYLRLSKADGDKEESDSIENQRKLLNRCIGEMEGAGGSPVAEATEVKHLEYIDDGCSGKDFKRPGFQRMLMDCRRGKVSTILVKDLSRLGRDYIEVNSYLEDIFPFLHVRVISVGERYDSGAACCGELSFDVQFSNMVNTYYLRDTAVKSMAGLASKWKRGELTSRMAPLGYMCKNVKEGWELDGDGAGIVRLVFDLALEGLGTGEIAAEMNRREIPTPYVYLKKEGLLRGGYAATSEDKMAWSSTMVYSILKNEAYTGLLVQGKRRSRVPGKGFSRKVPDELLWKHEGKHEAIVSKEEFQRAQSVIQPVEKRRETKPRDSVLKGTVWCRNCGKRMVLDRHGNFYCSGSHQGEFTGCVGRWKETILEDAVRKTLAERGKRAEELLRGLARSGYDFTAAKAEIEELKAARMKKYEAYLRGTASRDEFMEVQAAVKERITALESQTAAARVSDDRIEEAEALLKPLAEASAAIEENGLTKGMVGELVERVWIGDEIEVRFKADAVMEVTAG